MRRCLSVAWLAASICCASSAGAEGLEPYQMMRSLQLLQDRIADGDHAALPMQRSLIAIIDKRLRAADAAEFENPLNLNALLVYGASGGNPATLDQIVSGLELDDNQRRLSDGLIQYARGDLAAAREKLTEIDLSTVDPELAAPLALVIGSLLAQQAPSQALELFDRARLVSPGTLIEEAALRRSIALSAELRDAARFTLASRQYVSRFLRSPYASQFAEAFVAGVIALHDEIEPAVIEEVAAAMRPDQAHVVYLRIARQSAIEGYDQLLAFAADNAEKYAGWGAESDPRGVLYRNIALVSSENVRDVLDALQAIDERRLSANDRKLLNAATEIAQDILAPPRAGRDVSPQQAAFSGGEAPASLPADDALNEAFVAKTRQTLRTIDALIAEERP